jgi:hypothetical protein
MGVFAVASPACGRGRAEGAGEGGLETAYREFPHPPAGTFSREREKGFLTSLDTSHI